MKGPFSEITVILVITLYFFLLSLIASLGERYFHYFRSKGWDRYIYVLAAGVYCTSWTFYGCIGNCAHSGYTFLALFIGPSIFALTWWVFLRKVIRVCREFSVTSVPDLLSIRYGRSSMIGIVSTLFLLVAIVPYIALQLRAIRITLDLIGGASVLRDYVSPTFLITVYLAIFALAFGGRYLDLAKRQGGILSAIAFESVVKILIFLVAGAFIVFSVSGGLTKVYSKALESPELSALLNLSTSPGSAYGRWMAFMLIAVFDVVILPRQFHVLVVQNTDEKHVKTLMWMFPLYMLIINAFVIPVALSGRLLGLSPEMGDRYILSIPLMMGKKLLSLFVFLGGFSAATAMVIVSTIALGKMLANNIFFPIILRLRKESQTYQQLLFTARVSMLLVIFLGYLYTVGMSRQSVLMEIGLISFAGVAQFGPATFGAFLFRRGNKPGVLSGLTVGFGIWFMTLVIPALVKAGLIGSEVMTRGVFGISALKPHDLFNTGVLDPVTGGIVWSLFFNAATYVVVSYLTEQKEEEVRIASYFVNPERESEPVEEELERESHHYVSLSDLSEIVERYAGKEKVHEVDHLVREIKEIRAKYGSGSFRKAGYTLQSRIERILTGAIGPVAAKGVMRDLLPLTVDEAKGLLQSYREMERSLRVARERVVHQEEEIRAKERFLASLVRSIDDGIVSTDLRGRITDLNEGALRLIRGKESDLTGKEFWSLLKDSEFGELKNVIRTTTARQGSWRGEVTILRKDGSECPVLLSSSRIIDDGGRVSGFVFSLKDMEEFKKMQVRLIQSEKLASLGQMAAGVAHEIRNPLGSIRMCLKLLKEDGVGREVQDLLENIEEAITSMETIVNELLDYTRDIKLQVDEFNVADVLRGALAQLEEQIKEKRIKVEMLDGIHPVYAKLDGVRMKQVFVNLIKNAIDSVPAGEGRVLIFLEENHDQVIVTIEDNGEGMDEERLKNAFQPFFTTKAQGVGLGLPIVKRIIELHGGEVSLESSPGEGTRVRVIVPKSFYMF